MRRFLRPRFSLWAMLVLITVIAIPLSYVAQRRSWNLRRKAAFEVLFRRGVWFFDAQNNPVSIWDSSAPKPSWWESVLKEGSVPQVHRIFLNGVRREGGPWDMSLEAADVGDAELMQLACFPEIEDLDILDSDRISDMGLRVVSRLPKLKDLWLRNCPKVTGAFLADAPRVERIHLAALKSLTVSELRSLPRLPNLKCVDIFGCGEVTKASTESIHLGPDVTFTVLPETENGRGN